MKKSAHGFTLVELLVVISILAILATVSIILFSGVQKNVRDARRKADINSIAAAIELKKDQYSKKYSSLVEADFSTGQIPKDPASSKKYCIQGVLSNTAISDPPSNWDGASCPTNTQAGPNGYVEFKSGYPACTAVGASDCVVWKVCTSMESGTVYCKKSIQ